MKKTILLIVFCAGSMMLFAQQTNNNRKRTPPQSVQRSWQKDYPNHNNEDWEYRNNQWHTKYKDSDHGDRNVDVYYDRNGRRVMSQSQWDRNDLPDRVKERIKARYRSDNYTAFRIEKPGKGFYFQITLGKNRKVYMDERGREVKHY